MADLVGQTLGSYRVIEQIGIGGMATVYKAYQPSMDRYVAIKVLPAVLSRDAAFLKRFQREAKVVARLEHKHILPIYDYGEQEGLTYLVMRYVEAGTLKDRLAAGRLDLTETSRIIAQVGAALDYAHRLGVIHRDVKPSNVLIDSQGDAYLTDFGLARMVESSDQLTATGVGVGTPAYMSPEQGQGLKIDHRSDIYSLGVMLYEMVTGQVPYQAETPMAVVLKHITEPLPLPRQFVPDLPEEVERVILKALAKKTEDRFQMVREMVEALDLAVQTATAAVPTAVRKREAIPPALAAPARQIRWPGNVRTMMLGGGIAVMVLSLVMIICGLAFILNRLQYLAPVILPSTTTITPSGKPAVRVTPVPTKMPVPTAVPVKQEWVNLRSFPAPAANPSGIVRMADDLGVVASRGRQFYRLDLEGNIIAEMDIAVACSHMTWDGESLWCAENKTVYKVDLASGQELARFEVDLSDIKGIAWDGPALWLVDTDGNLARYDSDGQRLRRLAVTVTGWPISLAWAAGELWVADVPGNVTRLDSEFNKVGSFSLSKCGVGSFPYDVALYWDGESLWLADTGQNRILQCTLAAVLPVTPVPTAIPASKIAQEWVNLRSFPAPAANPSGIVRMADDLGVVASRGRQFYRLDLEGNIIAEMDIAVACSHMAWDGESLWCAANKTVYEVDPASGQELARFEVDMNDIRGITWDGESLWLTDVNGNLARYDRAGQRLRRLAVAVTGWPTSLAWAAGELWVADVHGNVTCFDSEFNKSGSFGLAQCGAGSFPYEVALYWDGESLWLADAGQNRILQCAPAD